MRDAAWVPGGPAGVRVALLARPGLRPEALLARPGSRPEALLAPPGVRIAERVCREGGPPSRAAERVRREGGPSPRARSSSAEVRRAEEEGREAEQRFADHTGEAATRRRSSSSSSSRTSH